MIKRVLGFDVSSSCIGYCLLEIDDESNNIHYIKMDYLKPIKDGSIIEKLYNTKNIIRKIIEDLKPDYIGIENIIEYIQNKSSSKSIITLAVFNRMVCLAAFDYLGKSPELFNVLTIRHGLKLNKELPQKSEMPALVSKILKITFPYIYKKTGKINPISEDMADGTAVALYYSLILTNQIIPKKKPTKTKIKKAKNNNAIK